MAEKNDTVFVCGAEGIGKTEMCRKFAEGWTSVDDGNGKRPAVWLEYDGDLRSTIAWHLKIDGINENETMDEEKLFMSKLSVLAADPRTLLIIDNFNDADAECLKFVSRYGFKKIFITGNAERAEGYCRLELNALSADSSFEMFMRSLRDDRKDDVIKNENDVRSLLRNAGYHTLTVELIARHLNTHATGSGELLRMLLEIYPSTANGNDITAADRITGLLDMPQDDIEKDVLRTVSMLPASGMPLGRFTEFSELENENALVSLEERGWIKMTIKEHTSERMISAHPLIIDILRKEYPPKDDGYCVFFSSLERFFDFGRAYNNWAEKMDLLPILISVTDASSPGPYAPIFYSLAGRYLRGSGNYDASLRYYFKALEDRERRFGTDHPSIAPTHTGIGNVYADKGEYDKAVDHYIRALKVSGRMSGINDQSIAATYNNVGLAYAEKGEYVKALEYYEKALEIREKVLGEDHQDTAVTYNNMGNAYSDGEEYDKALEYYEKALDARERTFGAEHYYTAVTYSNVGVVHFRKGEYGKALEHLKKAANIMRRTVGTDHPDTVAAYEMIAYIHDLIGDDVYDDYKSPPPSEDWNFMYR